MAYIQKRGERKFKITVCNGYRTNGQKRMQARTIDVPKTVVKHNIKQYVFAEAERMEKRFKTGIDQDEQTKFETYANEWLRRKKPLYKASTLAGYTRMLEWVYPLIGGVPLCKMNAILLEEMCASLRKRKTRSGKAVSEATIHKYLDTVSAVLEEARKSDILLYNPAHRVQLPRIEKRQQHIPQEFEMNHLLQCVLQEPLLYRLYYLMARSTGLRRGELCALRWTDIRDGRKLMIRRSRGGVLGQGVQESDTKNHRVRVVAMPQLVDDYLQEWFVQKFTNGSNAKMEDLIFTWPDGRPIYPDTFSRHLRTLLDKNELPKDLHLHSLRHFFATYLLENNVSKQVAAELLGHADTAFLERTYCHPQDSYKTEAANILNDLLAPADDKAWEQEQQLLGITETTA